MFSVFPRLYGCLLILVSENGLRLFVILVLCGGAASCREQGAASQELPPDEIGLALSGLNYTDMPIGVMYANGSWAGGLDAHSGCCGFAGGVGLPYPWKPGTKVVVKWSDDELFDKDPAALYAAKVEIPSYEMIYSGFLWVAFLPGKKVKVYASRFSPGHPEFPDGLQVPRKICNESAECRDWLRGDSPPREGYY